MELSVYEAIDVFRKRMLENSILNEMANINNLQVLSDEVTDRKNQLMILLDDINMKSKTKTDATQELNDMFASIEKQMHMQPWNKLQESYKIDKITEYSVTNQLSEEHVKKLIQLTKEGILTPKYVIYNQLEQKISDITLLEKDDKGIFKFDDATIKKIVNTKLKNKNKK